VDFVVYLMRITMEKDKFSFSLQVRAAGPYRGRDYDADERPDADHQPLSGLF
jgi:hypothetical protein